MIRFDPETGERRIVLPALGSGYAFERFTAGRLAPDRVTLESGTF